MTQFGGKTHGFDLDDAVWRKAYRNVTGMTVLCTTFGRLVRRIAEALMV